MLIPIHEEMTREALGAHFSPRAMEIILAANLKQDALSGQIGHDEFHFDNNAIDKGLRYINEQRGLVIAALLGAGGALFAWAAFGRLTHSAQDFYSHTNYIPLWLEQHKDTPPAPGDVDALQKSLLQSPGLHSGKLYMPMDWLYFIPFLRNTALKLLPADSHAKMNLDSPKQGPLFEYARAAAVQRTRYELELLRKILTPEMFGAFTEQS